MSQQKYRWIPALSGVAIGLLFLGVSDTARAQTVTLTGSNITNNTLNVTVQQGGVSAGQPVTVAVTEGGTSIQSNVNVQASSTGNWLQVQGSTNLDVGTPVTLLITVNAQNLLTGTQPNGTVTVALLSNPSIKQVLTVVVTVTGSSLLTSSPSSLSFSTIAGTPAADITPQVLTISSSGATLSYNVTYTTQNSGNWLTLFNGSGTTGSSTTDTISVGINPAGLLPNVYQGSITVQSTSTTDSVLINVTLTVAPNTTLSVTPATLQTFLYQAGTVAQAGQLRQTLQVASTGSSVAFQVTMNPSVPWLVISPTSSATGTAGGAVGVTLTVTPGNMAAGSYTTSLVVGIVNGAPLPGIPVKFVISNNPLLSLSTNTLNFTSSFGSATPPPTQVVQVSTIPTNSPSVAFTLSSDSTWLTATESTLTTPSTITVSVNSTNFAVGPYVGHLTITPNNSDASLYNQVITVNLTVGNTATVTAGPPLLIFSYQLNQQLPVPQVIELFTTGQSTTFTVTPAVTASANCPAGWLTATPNSNTTQNADITVSANVSGMTSPGQCPGSLTISYPASSSSPQTLVIPVTVNISNSAQLSIGFQPGFGIVNAPQGGSAVVQTITLTSTDPATPITDISISESNAPFLFLGNNGTTTPETLQVSFNPGVLTPNAYAGTISISSSKLPASPLPIPVTLTISSTTTVTVAPQTLTFNQSLNGSLPAAQNVTLTSSSGGGATFQASVPTSQVCSWLQVSPTSGAASGPVTFTVVQNSLPQNSYPCPVTFSFLNSATNTPVVVTATLVVGPGQTLTASPASLTFAYQVAGSTPASQPLTLTSTQGSVAFTASATSNGGWLLIDTTSGSTGTALSKVINVSINPANFPAGTTGGSTLSGQITINASPVLATPITVAVTVNVTAAQVPTPVTIINSATFGFGAIAPGELIAIRGTNLGPACVAPATNCVSGGTQFTVTAQNTVSSTLSGVQVLFDSIPGTPTFVSPTQINVIVPWDIAGRVSTNMVVTLNSVQSAAFPLQVVAVAPGIYTQNATGSGQAAALNLSAQAASPYNGPAGGTYFGTSIATAPAPQGSVVVFYLTGGGLTNPGSTDGSISSGTTLMPLKNWTPGSSVVTATVGNVPATVVFAGAAPTLITGVVQINLQLPAGVTGNALPVVITIDGITTQITATIAAQ